MTERCARKLVVGPLALLLLLALVSAACGRAAPTPGGPEGVPSSPPPAPQAGGTVGSPADPLPPPLPAPGGPPDEAAAALAARVLAGGDDALPALLTALQAGGIAVRGPDGALAVEPPDGGQGLALSAWEARFMAGLVGQDHTLLVPLTALQDLLVQTAPELQGEPVAQRLLDGIRAHAQGQDGALRAWAQLIVALGRQRQGDSAQDLLGPVDPAAVQLDAVQLSLITLRLMGDLAALEDASAAAPPGAGAFGAWLVPRRAHAAAPCTQEEPPVVSREKVSASGFDALKGMLRERVSKSALARAGRAVRDYRTLALALAALRIEVAMDPPGPPLVRTKTTAPGQERTITARVTLDPEVLGTVECARALLAALGLKFNVGSPAGGGVQGVPLTWRLVQGHDVLLEQEGAQGVTDQNGADTFLVLGKPQERDLGASARRVSKQGAVAVRFNLRPYTLIGGDAPGGRLLTPPEVLLDLSYGYEVTYPFEVVDWEGGGRWTGTITYTETQRTHIATQGQDAGNTSEETSSLRIVVALGETEQEVGDQGTTMAMVRGSATGEYSLQGSSSGWYRTYCSVHGWVTLSGSSQAQMAGRGSGPARIVITTLPGDQYYINASSDATFEASGQRTTQNQVCAGGNIESRSESSPLGPSPFGLGIPRTFGGSVRPEAPDALSGSLSSTETTGDTTVTWTINWQLQRS